MTTSTIGTQENRLALDDIRDEDQELFDECFANVLKNVEKNLHRSNEDEDKVAKLLTIKWLLK